MRRYPGGPVQLGVDFFILCLVIFLLILGASQIGKLLQ